MSFAKIKVITFDIGGTLLFPHPSVGEVYARVLAKHGRSIDPAALDAAFLQVWEKHALLPLREISEAAERARWREVVDQTMAGLAVDGVDMDLLFEELWQAFARAEHWRWPDDTGPALAELRERGFRLAVFSNWDSRLRPLLSETGLADFFDAFFISCEIGCEKPHPSAFRKVLEWSGRAPEEILHIGDSPHHDIEGARKEGWRALQMSPGEPCPKQGTIASPQQILPLVPDRV